MSEQEQLEAYKKVLARMDNIVREFHREKGNPYETLGALTCWIEYGLREITEPAPEAE
ncbi:MAG: hypothetical protein LBJ90_06485 [Treponema sp.]|jgi:hypothetical protein|nr:hypothetical protein [Treponema sp.]